MTKPTPRIEISRPGRFTATDGTVVEFTAADLAASAAAYDYAAEPAPLVVGHPAMNAPAYGWAASLTVEGDKLVATPRDVLPAFAEQVNAGSYKRVSASWYPPRHPQNPKPDVWYLKHIGFLGAAAPAIRGLAPVHFSEAQLEGAVTIDLTPEEPPMATAEDSTTTDFAERDAALSEREQSLNEREAGILTKEAELLAAAKLQVHTGNVDFAAAQVAAGKLKPFGQEAVIVLLDVLSAAAPVNFGEATGELAPADAFRKLFDDANPVVDFSERAPVTDDPVAKLSPEAIADKAVEFMEAEKTAGRTITVQAAVRHVQRAEPGQA